MRVLAIEAHLDDVELGCGGTLLKHRDQGDELFTLCLTHSSYEVAPGGYRRTKEEALREGMRAAAQLGSRLTVINNEPLVLTATEKLVLEIEAIVRDIRPERVYTHHPNDVHADHAAVGSMSLRACRKINEVFFYRSNWYFGTGQPEDNFYVDISPQADEKLQLISYFESEIGKANNTWPDFVRKQNQAAGARIGVAHAETFSVLKMTWL